MGLITHLSLSQPLIAQVLLPVDCGIIFGQNRGKSLVDKLPKTLVTRHRLSK